jgi:hypothetical protein
MLLCTPVVYWVGWGVQGVVLATGGGDHLCGLSVAHAVLCISLEPRLSPMTPPLAPPPSPFTPPPSPPFHQVAVFASVLYTLLSSGVDPIDQLLRLLPVSEVRRGGGGGSKGWLGLGGGGAGGKALQQFLGGVGPRGGGGGGEKRGEVCWLPLGRMHTMHALGSCTWPDSLSSRRRTEQGPPCLPLPPPPPPHPTTPRRPIKPVPLTLSCLQGQHPPQQLPFPPPPASPLTAPNLTPHHRPTKRVPPTP